VSGVILPEDVALKFIPAASMVPNIAHSSRLAMYMQFVTEKTIFTKRIDMQWTKKMRCCDEMRDHDVLICFLAVPIVVLLTCRWNEESQAMLSRNERFCY
jgi:hypothetical protein